MEKNSKNNTEKKNLNSFCVYFDSTKKKIDPSEDCPISGVGDLGSTACVMI